MARILSEISLFLALIILLAGCAHSAQTIVLDIRKPAQTTLPKYVHKVTLLNNTVIQPPTAGHELLVPQSWTEYRNRRFSFQTDTLPSLFLTKTAEILNQTKYFTEVLPVLKSERTTGNFLASTPPTTERLAQIADQTNADLILTLERMPIKTTLLLEPFMDGAFIRAVLTIVAQPEVSLYFPREGRYGSSIIGGDTLVLDRTALDVETALGYFPTASEMEKDLAEKISDQLVRKIIPSIQTEERLIYSNDNPNMQDALRYTQQEKWQEAYWIWEYLVEKTKNRGEKADILTNMALYFELNDTFAEAIRLVTEAITLLPENAGERREYLDNYLRILKERKAESQKLSKQVGH